MTRKQRLKIFDLLVPHQNLSGAVGNRIAEHQAFGAGLSAVCQFGEGWVKPAEIDKYGLAKALRLGVKRALVNLGAETGEKIIMDGKVNYLPVKFKAGQCQICADNLVPIVSAASIYAKVTRDKYMSQLAKQYPAYSFERHAGYGTRRHIEALNLYGSIKNVHRLSYAPVAKIMAAA